MDAIRKYSQLLVDLVVLGLVVLIAYAPGLRNGFVYDDGVYVLSNPLVSGKLDVPRIFTESYPPGRPEQGLYRPLVTLSFALDHKIWDGFAHRNHFNGFHLTNSLIHALNVGLFLLLLRRLGVGRWLRFFACMIFGLHPVFSEAVAWIVGRAELLGMSFGLLALLSFLYQPRGAGVIGAWFFWILAMLCKEHWLMLPALAAVLWMCLPAVPRSVPTEAGLERRAIFWLASLTLLLGIMFWMTRSHIIGAWRPGLVAYKDVVSEPARVATALALLWKYVGIWAWPAQLSVHHDVHPIDKLDWLVALCVSWLFIFWLAWRLRLFFPWFTLAVGWFWIAIFPVSNLLFPVGAVFGERFLYLPALFFAPTLVLGVNQALSVAWTNTWRKSMGICLGTICCVLLLAGLWSRLDDWRSELSLWEAAARYYPQSLAIKAPLSEALLREGRFGEAHILAEEALEELEHRHQVFQKLLEPGLMRVNANAQSGMRQLVWVRKFHTANEEARSLHLLDALKSYQTLIDEFPERPETHEAIGDLYIRLQNPLAAKQHFAEALELERPTPLLLAKYAQVLSELGHKAEALVFYDRSLAVNPGDSMTHYNRGVVLGELGDYESALAAFDTAARLSPKFVVPHLNAAAILIHLKQYEKAKRKLDQVLALDSGQSEARELLRKIPGFEEGSLKHTRR